MIQKPDENLLAIDVHWFGRFTLRPQQGPQRGPHKATNFVLNVSRKLVSKFS